MQPEPIEASDMPSSSSSDDAETEESPQREERPKDKEDDGFLILGASNYQSVVDVYLGQERKQVRLPAKLARGLATLLTNAPERTTTYTPAEEDTWASVFLGGWWNEKVTTVNVSGNGNQPYHVTEILSFPQIGVDRFNAFKDWAKQKKQDLTEAGDYGGSGEQAKVSGKKLHLDLWTVLGHFDYVADVRASSEGAETASDPDDDVGQEHGGVPNFGPLYYPGDEKRKEDERWHLVSRPKDK